MTHPQPLTGLGASGQPAGHASMVLMALLLGLTGCSGSRFGEALSRSFSTPTAAGSPASARPPAATQATSPATPSGGTAALGSRSNASPPPRAAAPNGSAPAAGSQAVNPNPNAPTLGSSAAGRSPAQAPTGGVNARTTPAVPPRPAPYRVTILLPQADAAAPAEVVTQALRAAGVPFEVETIERLSSSTAPQAPLSRPAPPPR